MKIQLELNMLQKRKQQLVFLKVIIEGLNWFLKMWATTWLSLHFKLLLEFIIEIYCDTVKMFHAVYPRRGFGKPPVRANHVISLPSKNTKNIKIIYLFAKRVLFQCICELIKFPPVPYASYISSSAVSKMTTLANVTRAWEYSGSMYVPSAHRYASGTLCFVYVILDSNSTSLCHLKCSEEGQVHARPKLYV